MLDPFARANARQLSRDDSGASDKIVTLQSGGAQTAFDALLASACSASEEMNGLAMVENDMVPGNVVYETVEQAAGAARHRFLDLADAVRETPAPSMESAVEKIRLGLAVDPTGENSGNAVHRGWELVEYVKSALTDLDRIAGSPSSHRPMREAPVASLAGTIAEPIEHEPVTLPPPGGVDCTVLEAMIAEYWRRDRLYLAGDERTEQLRTQIHGEFDMSSLDCLNRNLHYFGEHPSRERWEAERAAFLAAYEHRGAEIGLWALNDELARLDDDRWAQYLKIAATRPCDINGAAMLAEFALRLDSERIDDQLIETVVAAVLTTAGRAVTP